MIKYQLVCELEHEFEGWFQTGAAFDTQNHNRLVNCPVCDSSIVRRALMTPNLVSSKSRSGASEMSVPLVTEGRSPAPLRGLPAHAQDSEFSDVGAASPTAAAVGKAMSQLRQLQRQIKAECRDVGHDFAREARKIHYGESAAENIYGRSTEEERETLADEGIDFAAMPWLPPEH
ncbi:DUF1178 family protein [Candidatus Puniceispirillum sp.]|nr:DUF1178 family protein [Candidatus Puniceispirillum sp.]